MTIEAPPAQSAPIIACHECGTVHRMACLRPWRSAACSICGATLFREQRNSVERTLGLAIAALLLLAIANLFPLMTIEIEGREQASTIMDGVIGLYNDGMWPLAALVFVVAILMPLAKVLMLVYVLLPLHVDRRAPGVATVFRWVETAHPWAMTDVYLLGLIVAYVKLADFAAVEAGVALFALVGAILLTIAADVALDARQVWNRLAPQATDRLLQRSDLGELVSCHGCDQLYRLQRSTRPICTRCGADLHKRVPDSIAITWALTIAAFILYIPANMLPIMRVVQFGQGEPQTIISGVMALINAGLWPIAALVFVASIAVPVIKLVCMAFLLITVQRRSAWRPRDCTLMYRIVEGIGRWSMVDVFMISLLVALVSLGAVATIEPGPGAIAFAAVVIITMIAAMTFDSRLIWDAVEEKGDVGQPVRA